VGPESVIAGISSGEGRCETHNSVSSLGFGLDIVVVEDVDVQSQLTRSRRNEVGKSWPVTLLLPQTILRLDSKQVMVVKRSQAELY
jgi:hypothetical protein